MRVNIGHSLSYVFVQQLPQTTVPLTLVYYFSSMFYRSSRLVELYHLPLFKRNIHGKPNVRKWNITKTFTHSYTNLSSYSTPRWFGYYTFFPKLDWWYYCSCTVYMLPLISPQLFIVCRHYRKCHSYCCYYFSACFSFAVAFALLMSLLYQFDSCCLYHYYISLIIIIIMADVYHCCMLLCPRRVCILILRSLILFWLLLVLFETPSILCFNLLSKAFHCYEGFTVVVSSLKVGVWSRSSTLLRLPFLCRLLWLLTRLRVVPRWPLLWLHVVGC